MDKKIPGVSAALKYLANSSDPADVVSGELLQERLNDYSVELSTWKKTARDLKKERDELARALAVQDKIIKMIMHDSDPPDCPLQNEEDVSKINCDIGDREYCDHKNGEHCWIKWYEQKAKEQP